MKELTVKELREALEGVPDDLPVRLSSDTGVDQGYGDIIIEKACWIKGEDGWFDIYANDHCDDMPDCDDMPNCENLPDDEFNRLMKLLGGREK